jgi:hypothetical protein
MVRFYSPSRSLPSSSNSFEHITTSPILLPTTERFMFNEFWTGYSFVRFSVLANGLSISVRESYRTPKQASETKSTVIQIAGSGAYKRGTTLDETKLMRLLTGVSPEQCLNTKNTSMCPHSCR